MPNGKPGDHPLTDIFVHKQEVYGKEIDELIKKISILSSCGELDDWWENEIGWDPGSETILSKARKRYEELVARAKERGWELDEW